MDSHTKQKYIEIYKKELLENVLPFWTTHSVDDQYGGFMFCLDRDGTVIDTDKGMWQQGRFTWLLATLYNELESRKEWLDLALHGIRFIDKFGFDDDGRMFFHVTREGLPIRKRRYIFTESFAAIAYAALYKATGEKKYEKKARDLFNLIIRYITTPGLIPPKFTSTRPVKGLAVPMIMIVTAQELRKNLNDTSYTMYIDQYIREIRRDFMKPELKAVLETVGPHGEFLDHFDGRLITPGHAIEAAWFIMNESRYRNTDNHLLETGLTILDWMWKLGWDDEYGGILYFRDAKGFPVQEYWQDMKFWWPHNETIIATLLAHVLTNNQKYEEWHKMIHNWTFTHFPDPTYKEWFGYLHRDGSISVPLKGNLWKGPFHIPRMLFYSWKLLEDNELLL